jgi:hypothetical protein
MRHSYAILLLTLLTLGAGPPSAQTRAGPRLINVSTAGTSLTLLVAGDGRVYQLGYGRPRQSAAVPSRPPAREDEFYPQAGNGFILEPAVQAVHADGNTSTDLVYLSHESTTVDDNVTLTRINLKDGFYPFFVTLNLRAYRREDVIEQWAEIRHEEEGPVTLSRFENITFSNLVLKDVTGPISIGLDSASRRRADDTSPVVKGIVRNITFNGIRASVVAVGRQHADLPFKSEYRPGETRQCIVLNGAGEELLEGISFQDVHVSYEGGGTLEEAAREVPQMAGEYFEIGTPPAYGLYARGVRGLTLNNVRFDVKASDQRPAVVFDRVSDASVNGLAADGDARAAALLRFVDARDVPLTASRVLKPAAVFLRVEGSSSEGITIDEGDISKAAAPVAFERGASAKSVKLRA